MNDDVLANIAGFCDIDSRRVLGTRPLRVRRNTDFDTRLAAIHGMRANAVTHQRCDYTHWRILLNDKLTVCILQRCPDDCAPFLDYMTVSARSDHPPGAQYTCDMGKLPERAYSVVCVNDGHTSTFVHAEWINGKWTVCMDDYGSHLWPLIRQLGYTPVYNR